MNSSTQAPPLLLPAGIHPSEVFHNADPATLIEMALAGGARISSTGALMMDTGIFTGRSPEDKFIVNDKLTEQSVWWGDVNKPFAEENFYKILARMSDACLHKRLYVQDVYACADPGYRMGVRVITSLPTHALFAYNMFIRPEEHELEGFRPDYTVLCLPEFEAIPDEEGTRSPNFAVLNLSRRMILIGGTGYTGEIKKSIFSVLNFVLPRQGVLSMHCSANVGEAGDAAVFFGLSGTGKTTLSADPARRLLGDDEHGWSGRGLFNFEGGCYAKVINLSSENEPQIFSAIREGAMLENVRCHADTDEPNYADDSVTANTRVSYPLHYINSALIPSISGHPKNIFFLTADAMGVMPPIARLNEAQAMFHFVSGYTARVAGTEMGVSEPKVVFSACFGAPFMPLHPLEYARLLASKMGEHGTHVYLINTGWTGGAYGTGKRISIPHTRALITAALEGKLEEAIWTVDPIFGFEVPDRVDGVPSNILQPRDTWTDPQAYDRKAQALAEAFVKNMAKYQDAGRADIMAGGPVGMRAAQTV